MPTRGRKPTVGRDVNIPVWVDELRAPAGREGAEAVENYNNHAYGRDLESTKERYGNGQFASDMELDPSQDHEKTGWKRSYKKQPLYDEGEMA